MEKLKNMAYTVKNSLLGINFALIAFIFYVSKIIIHGAALTDAIVIFPIIALYAYTLYLKSRTPAPMQLNAEVQSQINEIQRQIRDAQMEKNLKRPMKRYF